MRSLRTRLLDGEAVCCDVFGVFVEGGGEAGLPLWVKARGYEVEVCGVGGVECSAESGEAGIGDGAGRQAGVFVGVVRGVESEVGGVDCAAIPAFGEEPVDDGRVGHEGHFAAEPVDEDAGDEWPLGGDGGFAFDERGERDDGMEAGLEADLDGGGAETLNHGGDDLCRGCLAGEVIGGGEEVALDGRGMGVKIGE